MEGEQTEPVEKKYFPVINRKGRRKSARSLPDSLKDYRFVYQNPEEDVGTPMQRQLRAMLHDDPAKFLDRLEKAEAAHRDRQKNIAVAKAEKAAVVDEGDEGEEKVLGLIESLLSEWDDALPR